MASNSSISLKSIENKEIAAGSYERRRRRRRRRRSGEIAAARSLEKSAEGARESTPARRARGGRESRG